MPTGRPFGITHRFQRLFQSKRYVGYVLLTLSPLYSSEDFRARLACLIHTASVRSEPGSNPSVELIWLCFFVESSLNSQPFPTRTRRPAPEVPTVTKRRHARTQIQESLCFQRTDTVWIVAPGLKPAGDRCAVWRAVPWFEVALGAASRGRIIGIQSPPSRGALEFPDKTVRDPCLRGGTAASGRAGGGGGESSCWLGICPYGAPRAL